MRMKIGAWKEAPENRSMNVEKFQKGDTSRSFPRNLKGEDPSLTISRYFKKVTFLTQFHEISYEGPFSLNFEKFSNAEWN